MLQENIKKIKECNSKDELRKISEEFKNLDNEEKIKLRGYYIWKVNEINFKNLNIGD
jgi:hypothetical protein